MLSLLELFAVVLAAVLGPVRIVRNPRRKEFSTRCMRGSHRSGCSVRARAPGVGRRAATRGGVGR
jgi:hypothetical protein